MNILERYAVRQIMKISHLESRLADWLIYSIISQFSPCEDMDYTRLRNTKGKALIDTRRTPKVWFKEH